MRVLHVQKVKGIGGSERHLLSLLPGLAAAGVEVEMLVAATGDAARFVEPLRARGVPTQVVPAGRDLNPRLLLSIRREIRRFRPDVVHTHLFHGDLHGQLAARTRGVPGVSSVHGAHGLQAGPPVRAATALASGQARRVIAISHHVARTVRERGRTPAEAIRVVHYGIDVDSWELDAARRAEARRRFGIGPDTVAVGIASRVIPGKGHDLLIAALGSALADAPNLRLYVAGDGPELPRVRRLASGLPNGAVSFLGFVADVRSFLGATDVVAFPTRPELGEGFGLAALEAMAAARPVVATEVASLPEIVLHERTGLLVGHRTPAGLTAALAALACDPVLRRELGARGRERAREEFGLERMVERTLAVYGELA